MEHDRRRDEIAPIFLELNPEIVDYHDIETFFETIYQLTQGAEHKLKKTDDGKYSSNISDFSETKEKITDQLQ